MANLVERARELLLPEFSFKPAVERWFWDLAVEEYLRRKEVGELDEEFQLKFVLLREEEENWSHYGTNWGLINWVRGEDITFAPSDLPRADELRARTQTARAEAVAVATDQLEAEYPPLAELSAGEKKQQFHEWLGEPLTRPQKKRAKNLLRKQQEK